MDLEELTQRIVLLEKKCSVFEGRLEEALTWFRPVNDGVEPATRYVSPAAVAYAAWLKERQDVNESPAPLPAFR